LVLDEVNLIANEGTILALLGRNGAGKTAIASTLSTLISSESGSMQIAGHDVVADPIRRGRSSRSPICTRQRHSTAGRSGRPDGGRLRLGFCTTAGSLVWLATIGVLALFAFA
jgi:energy-coupling factor transporter ATP-binding protein EcfA2